MPSQKIHAARPLLTRHSPSFLSPERARVVWREQQGCGMARPLGSRQQASAWCCQPQEAQARLVLPSCFHAIARSSSSNRQEGTHAFLLQLARGQTTTRPHAEYSIITTLYPRRCLDGRHDWTGETKPKGQALLTGSRPCSSPACLPTCSTISSSVEGATAATQHDHHLTHFLSLHTHSHRQVLKEWHPQYRRWLRLPACS